MSALPPLSVLDLFPVAAGTPAREVIHHGVALARAAEELSYLRYWVAEHHNMPSIATAAPEIIIGHVACATSKIRVGAGGIMVPNHTPLHVVEVFRTLEALHPGRIDLGLGRAPGTDPITAQALRRGGRNDPNELLAEILAFANNDFPSGHPFEHVVAMPSDVPLPPIWMLGSTSAGARIGAQLGTYYAFAGHFAMAGAADAFATYRREFRPSETLAAPHAMLAVNVICGDDNAHAQALLAPLRVSFAHAGRGGPRPPMLSVEEALKVRLSPAELAMSEQFLGGAIVGDSDTVARGLDELVERFAPDELMIATMVADPAARLRSYERVAAMRR